MANIDVGAVKQFQAIWGPVLDTIPAVLDLAAKQSDLEREINAKQKLLDKLTKQVEAAAAESEAQIAALKEAAQAVSIEHSKVASEVGDAKLALNKELEEYKLQIKGSIDIANAEAAQAVKDAKQAVKANNARIAELDAEYNGRRDALEAEIKAIEDRKAVAEKALDAIRAKLG